MSTEIVPFHPDMIPDAGTLLAQRHRTHRAAMPELPPRFEVPSSACAAVQAAWKRPGTTGVASLRHGRLIAYLIGETNVEEIWGRSGWIRQAGCAYALDEDVEIVRDLYAILGARWLKLGCFAHFALIPSTDEALNRAWYSLSFGIEHIHGLAALDQLDLSAPANPPDVDIRRAGPAEREALVSLSDLIWQHQVKAPVWGINLPERVSENHQGWAELLDDSSAAVWIAFEHGLPVAAQGYYLSETADDNLLVPDRCVHFTVAATHEQARGRGIGRLLAHEVFSHAIADGQQFTDTDWRSTNLLASRVWPHLGFRPAFNRLARRIDQRIAWANGEGWDTAST